MGTNLKRTTSGSRERDWTFRRNRKHKNQENRNFSTTGKPNGILSGCPGLNKDKKFAAIVEVRRDESLKLEESDEQEGGREESVGEEG